MDVITKSDLHSLLAEHSSPCISLYAPTHPAGRDVGDRLIISQLVDEAENRLVGSGIRAAEARTIVRPLRDLIADDGYWRDSSAGLAAFLAPDGMRRFRLSLQFAPRVSIGERFIVRPLLPLLMQDDQFFVLAVSQHRVQLLLGDRGHLVVQDVPGMPTKMDETVFAADQGRKQMHAGSSDPTLRHATIYHGHGGKPDARKGQIVTFLREMADPLHYVLRGRHAPLILAGIGSMLSLARKAITYPRVADGQIEGNCDRFTAFQLHQRAWPIMRQILDAERKHVIETTYAAAGPARCINDVGMILRAAAEGRVELLLAASDANISGAYICATAEENVQSPNDDLVDLAAVNTLRHRGKVFVVDREEVPGCRDMAAVLRKTAAPQRGSPTVENEQNNEQVK
jgi:hypothetical protein